MIIGPRNVKIPKKHLAQTIIIVLAGMNDDLLTELPEFSRHWRAFDELGTGSDDGCDFHR
jgi:hypothetical protein